MCLPSIAYPRKNKLCFVMRKSDRPDLVKGATVFKSKSQSLIIAFILFLFNSLSVEAFLKPLESENKQAENNNAPQLAQNINLSEFVGSALKDMGVPSGVTIPGLSDAKAFPVTGIKKSGPNITLAKIETGKIFFDLVFFLISLQRENKESSERFS